LGSNFDLFIISGIRRKYISFNTASPLDEVVVKDECIMCSRSVEVKVRDLLYQPIYGGSDYEEGGLEATVRCGNEEEYNDCGGIYVTRVCYGSPSFDSGKFHNHCMECPGFGRCIGDYREAHCRGCNGHYFAGSMGDFECHTCERRGFGAGRGGDDCNIM